MKMKLTEGRLNRIRTEENVLEQKNEDAAIFGAKNRERNKKRGKNLGLLVPGHRMKSPCSLVKSYIYNSNAGSDLEST